MQTDLQAVVDPALSPAEIHGFKETVHVFAREIGEAAVRRGRTAARRTEGSFYAGVRRVI